MKKEISPIAANAAQTVENENGTKKQTTPAPATVETTESGTPAPTVKTDPKPPTPATETVKSTAETIEDLKRRLEIELNRLTQKRKLANYREKFLNSMNSLKMYMDELKNENEFETQSAKLTFNILVTDKYDRANFTDVFSISNTVLIRKFCNLLFSEMEQKVTELEKEFLSA